MPYLKFLCLQLTYKDMGLIMAFMIIVTTMMMTIIIIIILICRNKKKWTQGQVGFANS